MVTFAASPKLSPVVSRPSGKRIVVAGGEAGRLRPSLIDPAQHYFEPVRFGQVVGMQDEEPLDIAAQSLHGFIDRSALAFINRIAEKAQRNAGLPAGVSDCRRIVSRSIIGQRDTQDAIEPAALRLDRLQRFPDRCSRIVCLGTTIAMS